MFTRRIALFLVCVGLFVLFMGARLLRVGELEHEKYQKIVQSSESPFPGETGKEQSARQLRGRVHKEIRFATQNGRLNHSVQSRQSEFVFSVQDDHTEMVENMAQVRCFLQEELYYALADGREALLQSDGRALLRDGDPKDPSSWFFPNEMGCTPMQKLRFLEAEKATYYYKTNVFVAQEVKLQRFVAKGHDLVETVEGLEPNMKGVAQAVEFTLSGKDLNFRAHHLKAKFFSSGGIL